MIIFFKRFMIGWNSFIEILKRWVLLIVYYFFEGFVKFVVCNYVGKMIFISWVCYFSRCNYEIDLLCFNEVNYVWICLMGRIFMIILWILIWSILIIIYCKYW